MFLEVSLQPVVLVYGRSSKHIMFGAYIVYRFCIFIIIIPKTFRNYPDPQLFIHILAHTWQIVCCFMICSDNINNHYHLVIFYIKSSKKTTQVFQSTGHPSSSPNLRTRFNEEKCWESLTHQCAKKNPGIGMDQNGYGYPPWVSHMTCIAPENWSSWWLNQPPLKNMLVKLDHVPR